jgi:hypothetical protein
MAIQKTYFILPNFTQIIATPNLQVMCELNNFTIDGINQINQAWINENTPYTFKDGTVDWEYAECDPMGNNCVTGGGSNPNSFNFFPSEWGLDFALHGAVRRGLTTGSISGSTYESGFDLFGVDKVQVMNANPNPTLMDSAFFIYIDYTKLFNLTFTIKLSQNNSIFQYQFIIAHNPSKCQQFVYDMIINGSPQSINHLGFLTGENENPRLVAVCEDVVCEDCCFELRTHAYGELFIPPDGEVEDRGFDECCDQLIVLADENDSDPFKNDSTGFYHQAQNGSENVTFELVNLDTQITYQLDENTYGEFKDFGSFINNPLLSYFIVDWRKVITTLGTGNYLIQKSSSLGNLNYAEPLQKFTLKQYSIDVADGYARIEVDFDEVINFKNGSKVNFKGSNFRTQMRLKGFFGRPNREYSFEQIIYTDNKAKDPQMLVDTIYQFQSNQTIQECITNDFFDFILLATNIYFSDYNKNNHNYTFKSTPVKLESSEDVEYHSATRKARINLTFRDRFKNKKKTQE